MKHALITGCLFGVLSLSGIAFGEQPSDAEPNPAASAGSDGQQVSPVDAERQKELSPQDRKFQEMLSNVVMAGAFTIDGREGDAPKAERYTIRSATKVNATRWLITSQITYGKYDVAVPVPVEVQWAGDTPMIQVTNLSIPLLGEGFSARVLFYEGRYAGTWQHGKVGGHMFGRLEPAQEKPVAAPIEETPADEAK
ncbi:MAG: hypothetical protein KDA58_03890 [Planctomycetaceae bacterium]|nr:hypothetical protein [Planctomycetaceae bacterium]